MKLKDYTDGNLGGLKVKTPKGVVGYWKSQWSKGVWLSDGKSDRIYPQFVDDIRDALEWGITEEKVNCHKRIEMKDIDNYKKIDEKNNIIKEN
jgi:hypothetical protein